MKNKYKILIIILALVVLTSAFGYGMGWNKKIASIIYQYGILPGFKQSKDMEEKQSKIENDISNEESKKD